MHDQVKRSEEHRSLGCWETSYVMTSPRRKHSEHVDLDYCLEIGRGERRKLFQIQQSQFLTFNKDSIHTCFDLVSLHVGLLWMIQLGICLLRVHAVTWAIYQIHQIQDVKSSMSLCVLIVSLPRSWLHNIKNSCLIKMDVIWAL